MINPEAFEKLLFDLFTFTDNVKEFSGSYVKTRNSIEFKKIQCACLMARSETINLENLLDVYCGLLLRPTHTVYAGDLQYLWECKKALTNAYQKTWLAMTEKPQ